MRSHDYNCDNDEVHDFDYLGGSRGVLLAAANAKAQEERDLIEGRGFKARPNPSRLARSNLSTSTPPLSRSTLYLLLTVCSSLHSHAPLTHSPPVRPHLLTVCSTSTAVLPRSAPSLHALPLTPFSACAPYPFPQTLSSRPPTPS